MLGTELVLINREVVVFQNVSNDSNANSSGCMWPEYLSVETQREKLIATSIGGVIACIGIVCNIIILTVFCRNPKIHNSSTIFLQVLAAFDIGVLVTYVFLYYLFVIANVTRSFALNHLWAPGTKYIYPFSRFCQMTCTYIVVAISTDAVSTKRLRASWRVAAVKISFVCTFTFCSHVIRFYEVHIARAHLCGDNIWLQIMPTQLQRNKWYLLLFNFWYTNITNVFLPFIFLLIMCVKNLRMARLAAKYDLACAENNQVTPELTASQRARLRDMSKVLIILIIMHLVLNTLAVILIIIEFIDRSVLDNNMVVYTLVVDIINIQAVINSSYRIINYLIFNRSFREKVIALCKGQKLVASDSEQFINMVSDGDKKSFLPSARKRLRKAYTSVRL